MNLIHKIWRNILKRIQIHTIRTKLVISFLFIGLIPLIAFALLSYNIYLSALTDRITEYSRGVVFRMETDIDDYFKDIKGFLTREQDFYINQFIKLNQADDFVNNRKYTFRIWEDFNNLRQMKPGLEDISLTFTDGKRISCYGLYYVDVDELQQEIRHEFQEREISVIGPHTNLLRKEVITMVRPYYPEVADEIVLLSADINLSVLSEIANIRVGKQGYVFIADSNGRVIFHPDSQMIGKQSPFFLEADSENKFQSHNENQIITSTRSEVTGWEIVSVAYANEIDAELLPLQKIIAFIIGLILLIVILLTIYLSYSLSYPIRELENVTQRAANNDLTVKIVTHGEDEIAQLGKSFNKMIKRINKLMEQNIEEQKMLRELEMESLDNQIKPHFIYNTLDLIIGELENNKSARATHIIEALGRFFRLSLSHGKEMVKISNEIDHVKNYLFIQHLRHGEEYEYIIDIKDIEILDKYIPRLILQPIVENAIYHGILPSERNGLVVVKAFEESGDIYFEIVDNGGGIEEEKLIEINKILQGEEVVKEEKLYFGLRNVNRRLKIKYGDEYGLRIESEKGIKTRVIIKIGKRGGEASVQPFDS
ncbi:MAG: sensor histidine kinase [Halanaerobiales bacterium]